MCASAQGSRFAGFNPVGLPAAYCHVNSEKAICLIDLEEAVMWFCDKNKLDVDPENVPPLKEKLVYTVLDLSPPPTKPQFVLQEHYTPPPLPSPPLPSPATPPPPPHPHHTHYTPAPQSTPPPLPTTPSPQSMKVRAGSHEVCCKPVREHRRPAGLLDIPSRCHITPRRRPLHPPLPSDGRKDASWQCRWHTVYADLLPPSLLQPLQTISDSALWVSCSVLATIVACCLGKVTHSSFRSSDSPVSMVPEGLPREGHG